MDWARNHGDRKGARVLPGFGSLACAGASSVVIGMLSMSVAMVVSLVEGLVVIAATVRSSGSTRELRTRLPSRKCTGPAPSGRRSCRALVRAWSVCAQVRLQSVCDTAWPERENLLPRGRAHRDIARARADAPFRGPSDDGMCVPGGC